MNETGSPQLPQVSPGDPIYARWWNQIVTAVVARIVSGPGIQVRRFGNSITISATSPRQQNQGGPIVTSRTVLAEITGENGAGNYDWDLFVGEGPPSGVAQELNNSTGIIAGTRVVLHFAESQWWFFYPIEDCSEGEG